MHAVVQHTAYVHTPRARRRALHLAAAEACRDLVAASERAGFLARHLFLGGAGPRAVDALETAAADAIKRGAHEEAVLHLRREVELRAGTSAEEGQRLELPARLTSLGDELELLGRYLEAEAVLREAVELGARGGAQRLLAGCLRRLGEYDGAVALADDVLATAEDPEVRERISEEKGWSLAAQGRLDEAVAALEPTEGPLGVARQALLRGYCLIQGGRAADATAMLGDAARVLEVAGEPGLAARGLRLLGASEAFQGHFAEAKRPLQEGLELATRSGAQEEVAACLTNLAMVGARSDDLESAAAYARESVVQSDRMRHAFGRAMSRNNLADLLFTLGDAAAAERVASEAITLARASGLTQAEGVARHTRGTIRLAAGDRAGALADAELAAERLAGGEDEAAGLELLAQIREGGEA